MNSPCSSQNVFSIPAMGNHFVQVCKNELSQTETVSQYVKDGLLNGEAIILITRPALRKAVTVRLYELELDVQAFKNEGQIKFFDADFVLSSFHIDGELDKQSFDNYIGTPIQALKLKFGKVRAMGEMVDVLWKQGHHATALQLEDLWNGLSQKEAFSMLFTYLLDGFDPDTYDEFLKRICRGQEELISPGMQELLKSALSNGVFDVFVKNWNDVVTQFTVSSTTSSAPTM